MEIHVLSNGSLTKVELIRKASIISPHVDYIHLREKSWSAQELASAVMELCQLGVPLTKIVVNDRVDVAMVTGAAGVQLAWHSLPVKSVKQAFPTLRVGRSVHSVDEAVQASHEGADYVLYGHVFATASKPGLEPRGLEALESVVRSVSIPVIALGGITPGGIASIADTGAAGYAVMSAIMGVEDPYTAIQAYITSRRNGYGPC